MAAPHLAFSPARIAAGSSDALGVAWTLWIVSALCMCAIGWAVVGRLDRVAIAPGRLIAPSAVQVVQPYEAGIVSEIRVREGQYVERGALLMRMEPTFAEADRSAVARSVALNALQLRRIDAELTQKPLLRAAEDPDDLFADVQRQLRENQRAFRDALAQQRAAVGRAARERAAVQVAVDGLRRSLPLIVEQDDGWRRLAAEGFAGRLLALDRTRVRMERETEFAEQTQRVEALNAALIEARHRYDELVSHRRSDLQRERVEALAQQDRLAQEQAKIHRKVALLELKAPMAGIVKDLSTHTAGTVVQPAAVLLTLVPSEQSMIAEVQLRNEDAPAVRVGQAARVKLAAYPFQRHGTIDGTVEHVAPDASDRRTDTPAGDPAVVAGYRAKVRLHSTTIQGEDGAQPLQAGLLAQAEINLGTRSVLEYLLSPVQKVTLEAGRER